MEIAVTEFKAKCLKVMKDLSTTRQTVIITKRGKPIAKLIPLEPEPDAKLFGYMAGTATIVGDIVSPVEEPWSAISGDEDELYAAEPLENEKDRQ